MKKIYPHFFESGENEDQGSNLILSTLYVMSEHVIVAIACLVFELEVTTLSIVKITSFQDECFQVGDIVKSRNYKEIEKILESGTTYFWKESEKSENLS